MHYQGTGSRRTSARRPGSSSSPVTLLSGNLTADYPAGTQVQITGLATAAHLNDRLGTTVQPTKPLAAGRIDGQAKITSLSWASIIPLGDGGTAR